MGKCLSKGSGRETRKPVIEAPARNATERKNGLETYLPSSTPIRSDKVNKSVFTSPPKKEKANNNNSVAVTRITCGPSRTLRKYDRVAWIDEDGKLEIGTFKWIGKLDGEICVGLELDNKRTVTFGERSGKKLFASRPGHRGVVPLYQIMLLKDYEAKDKSAGTLDKNGTLLSNSTKTSNESPGQEYTESKFATKLKRQRQILRSEGQPNSHYPSLNGVEVSTISDNSSKSNGRSASSVTPRKQLPRIQGDPTWSPGDRVIFRNSKDEAEILEMKLEGNELVARIKYTEESSRPYEIDIYSLIDIMAESNLVVPPLLHDSLRRRSFLEAVSPTAKPEIESVIIVNYTKDESVQTLPENLSTELLSSFESTPSQRKTYRSIGVQTTNMFAPHSWYLDSLGGGDGDGPVDVVDYTEHLDYIDGPCTKKRSPPHEMEQELSYNADWSESFRKSQKMAAELGVIKLHDQSLKQEFDSTESAPGEVIGNGRDSTDTFEAEIQGRIAPSPITPTMSPFKTLEESRPLESPELVRFLARRYTYPMEKAVIMLSPELSTAL